MLNKIAHSTLWVASALVLAAGAAHAEKHYDSGATDTEIKIGQTMPLSGPGSAAATIGKVEAAYIRMINARGGINGRRINYLQYDDGYSPPKTVEQTRKLVEQDQVLLMFQQIGTPTSAAVQKYLNGKHVPQLFVSSGAKRFSDPTNSPWSMGFNQSYHTEGRVHAQYILANYPNAKIGILYQHDELGGSYLEGLKSGLGDRASKMIVAEESYENTDATVDSQILKLQSSGADLFYNISVAKFAAQAIKKVTELGWKPVQIVDYQATGNEVLKPAGPDNAKGIVSITYIKDMRDPKWKDDPGSNRFLAFMEKDYPEGDKTSSFSTFGYTVAQLLVEVLKRCGDDLTRKNVMRQATSLKNVTLDLLLPGITINTSPTDYRVNKQFQMMRFNGERWELFGPIVGSATKGG
jgi:branched-chain amino acid transport system substrate-binding protein